MRKGEAIFNAFVVIGPLLVGLAIFASTIAVNLVPLGLHASATAVLFLSGFSFFAYAKMSVIRQGQHLSFGSYLMTKRCKTAYFTGYALMAIGLLFLFGQAIVRHH